jgi:uncharacterized protein (DUF1800 family)
MPNARTLAWRRVVAAGAALLLAMPAAAGDWVFDSDFDETANGPYNVRQSGRFLTQATFGVKQAELARVEQIGYDAWLTQQFALPPTRHLPYLQAQAALGLDIYQNSRQEAWFKRALEANDQLRQRVAFALSEILVVSDQNGAIEGQPFAMANYYDILVNNAFGNYRELLEQVTLSPVMGMYLSMFKNRKADATENIRPDENYAREIMQLFSVGLVQLNPDGTPALSGGNPVPTYNQETIRGFAAVFTGWNWYQCPRSNPPEWWEWEYCPSGPEGNEQRGWLNPMQEWESYHASEGTKQLLVYPNAVPAGGVLAAGGTARADLETALDNVFRHPNVGPFLSYRLIQRLTTSNPSPAYVQRVAAKFNDDGTAQHVRGNLQAVVRAILMDPEARNPAQAPAAFGKLREPLLRTTHLYRALNARSDDGYYREWNPEYYGAQAVLRSPTVFNYFLPNYALPGEIAQAGLVSPEFQITTDTYLTRFANQMSGRVYWYWTGNPDLDPQWHDITVDLSPLMEVSAHPQRLVDRIDVLFMNGAMSSFMAQTIIDHVNTIDYNSWPGAPRERVQNALWLTLTSPEYVVEK